jgi:hypothetical protein
MPLKGAANPGGISLHETRRIQELGIMRFAATTAGGGISFEIIFNAATGSGTAEEAKSHRA